MVVQTVKCYRPDGSTRAIWSKAHARVHLAHDVLPQRGSHVIAILEGPRRGQFHVDFSPLAEIARDTRLRVCLTETYDSHEEAVEAERAWLLANWVLGL